MDALAAAARESGRGAGSGSAPGVSGPGGAPGATVTGSGADGEGDSLIVVTTVHVPQEEAQEMEVAGAGAGEDALPCGRVPPAPRRLPSFVEPRARAAHIKQTLSRRCAHATGRRQPDAGGGAAVRPHAPRLT